MEKDQGSSTTILNGGQSIEENQISTNRDSDYEMESSSSYSETESESGTDSDWDLEKETEKEIGFTCNLCEREFTSNRGLSTHKVWHKKFELHPPVEEIFLEEPSAKEKEMYLMEEHPNGLFSTNLNEGQSVGQNQFSPNEDSDCEVVAVYRSRSSYSETEPKSRDCKLKKKECNQCGRKFNTNCGMITRQRLHKKV